MLAMNAEVDPGFEIGGCTKCMRKRAKVFFQCHTHFQVHNQVWAPWNCDTYHHNWHQQA